MRVLERHDHSKAVGYVKKGNDAAINQASDKDFRFKNTLDTPIKIYASIKNKRVNITIKTIIKKKAD
jgi:vancomycin resistance protein YoaR